ncbi:MAG: putative baseplate assembly protein, partial [Dehalococcoidia bacterium]
MTESLLYRLNQVPDRLYLKFLEMMGITLYAPTPARALLTFRLSAPLTEPVTVPAGTEVATLQTAETTAIVFHTTRALEVVPPVLVSALTGTGGRISSYVDRLEDLRFDQRGLACFSDLEPGSGAYFGFEESLQDNVLRLDITAGADGIGVRPEDPPVVWEASAHDEWVPLEVLADGTGGLNRSGALELQMPDDHDPVTLLNRRAHWIRIRLLEPRPGQPTYTRSPEIRALTATSMGGSAAATHGERIVGEALGFSDGRPAQMFVVQQTPVLPREEGQAVIVRAQGEADEAWQEVDDFGRSGPEDRHYTWDGASGEIRFGPRIRQADGTDRQHGAVPPERAEVRVSSYLHGGGRAGNVSANQLTVLRSTIPFIDTVTNRRPAAGGVDGEV